MQIIKNKGTIVLKIGLGAAGLRDETAVRRRLTVVLLALGLLFVRLTFRVLVAINHV